MKVLALAILAALLLGARCDNIPGTLGPCGAYRYACPEALGGGCCGDTERCTVRGDEPTCTYSGPSIGAGARETARGYP